MASAIHFKEPNSYVFPCSYLKKPKGYFPTSLSTMMAAADRTER
jgi:hypothetical protein